MKAHFLKSIANVVSTYPENSANFSILTILFTHFQLISSFLIGYQKLPSNKIMMNVIIKVFRIFTLQILAEDLTQVVQIALFFFTTLSVVILVITFMIKYQSITRHWWYFIPITSPIMINIGARINAIHQTNNTENQIIRIINICCIFYFVITWFVRRLYFIETFGQANMSIHRQIYFWNIIVSFGNYLIFQFIGRPQIISIFSFGMTLLIIFISLFRFSYIYPELQYISFVCKFILLAVSGSQIAFFYFDSQFLYSLIILLVLVLFLQKLGVLKNLLVFKYIMLCKKSLSEQVPDQNYVVLVILICRKKAVGFKLGYQDYLQMAYIEILHKVGVNNFKQFSSLNRDYLFTYLQEKYQRSKQQDLNIFLAYWFLHYKMFIKAVKYMTYLSEQKDSFFVMLNSAILTQKNKIFLKNCRLLNVKQQEPASHSLCRMDPNALKQIDPQQMFVRQKKLQDFTTMMAKTFQVQINLIKKLMLSQLIGNQIQDLLKNIWQKKDKIIEFINKNKNQFEHKEFIIIQYLFQTVCCNKKFTVFELLQNIFLPYLTIDKNLMKDDFLAVVVSGQNETIGIIMLANKPMRQFFNLNSEKIRSASENIDQILPRSIAQQHNNMLYSFKQRGTSKFIGIPQNFYVVRQGEIFRADAYIKIYQHMDGLMFAGRLKLIDNNEKFILYDSQGFIQTYSKQFDFKSNKGELINIYDIIDNSGDVDILSKNNSILKYQNEIKGKRHGSEVSKNTMRKRFSDSKLKGTMMLVVGSKKVKANFDYFSGEKYFQGICIVSKLNEIDEEIEQHQKMLMSHIESGVIKKQNKSYKIPTINNDTEKNYFMLQYKIWKNKGFRKIILLFILVVSLYFIGAIFAVFSTNYLYFQHTQQLKTISNIQRNIKLQRTHLFQVGAIMDTLYYFNSGNLDKDSGLPFNHSSLQVYLNDTFQSIMQDMNKDYIQIIQNLKYMPLSFHDLLMQQQKIPTNKVYDYSLHQFQGLIEITFKQIANYEKIQYVVNWPVSQGFIVHYYNYFSSYLNNTVYPIINAFSKQVLQTQLFQQNILIFFCLSFIFAILFCVAIIFYYLIVKIRKDLKLITHVSNKQLSCQLGNIERGIQVIQKLSQYQVNNFIINNKYKTLSFDLKKQAFNFKVQQINKASFWEEQSQNTGSKKRKRMKFSLRISKYTINWILQGCIISIVIYYYVLLFSVSDKIINKTQFFQRYLDDISQVSMAQSGLLLANINTFIHGKIAATYLGIPTTEALQYYKQTIFRRKYVDEILKHFKWDDVKSMLFSSECKQGQTFCQNLLQSSLTMGVNTASISFALDNLILWNKIKAFGSQQIKQKLFSIFFSYFDYLKPLLTKLIKQSQTIFFSQMDEDLNYLKSISQIILVILIFFLVLGNIVNLIVINKEINSVYREILTIYSVDILTKHMEFAYQINKL